MAALEMQADAPVAVGTISASAGKIAQPAAKSKQKEEEDELAAMMAM